MGIEAVFSRDTRVTEADFSTGDKVLLWIPGSEQPLCIHGQFTHCQSGIKPHRLLSVENKEGSGQTFLNMLIVRGLFFI